MDRILNYIDGELIPPNGDRWFDNYNPATGEPYSLVPDSDTADVDLAVQAAKRAFTVWSTTPAKQRSDLLLRIVAMIEERSDDLARAESIDTGKPLSLAKRMDIFRAASNFHFFATAILHQSNESHPTDTIALNYTLRDPLGVAGCISPWNLPLYLFTWKIAPALASGNPVVAKPSELTPMTAYLLSKICIEAGLPPGVLNIVHGYGASVGAAITSHPDVPAISFTGGTATGAIISRTAAPMFKKLSLELGGKNPTIVFADCELEETLTTVVRSAFTNQGEICLCGSRIFIERSLYPRFVQEFLRRVEELRVGDPFDDETTQGAVISKQHMEKILSYVALAKEEGGTILTGGKQLTVQGRCEKGWFVAPTVIADLPHSCRTNQEEIFGPVVTVMPFDTEEDVLLYANSTQYGLAASVWTQNLRRAHRVAQKLEIGIVWINCWMLRDLRTPFGGVKSSGVGREGGIEALRFFTETKNVCIKL